MPYTAPSTPLSNVPPMSEANTANVGSGGMAARQDHQHQRLTSTTTAILDGNNEAVVVFTRTFDTEPGMAVTFREAADNQPIVFKIKSFSIDGNGKYVGCTVKGYRSTLLPTLSGIILIGPLISALSNLNIFGGSAAGISISVIAVQQSA